MESSHSGWPTDKILRHMHTQRQNISLANIVDEYSAMTWNSETVGVGLTNPPLNRRNCPTETHVHAPCNAFVSFRGDFMGWGERCSIHSQTCVHVWAVKQLTNRRGLWRMISLKIDRETKPEIIIYLFTFGWFSECPESFLHVQVARQTMSAFHWNINYQMHFSLFEFEKNCLSVLGGCFCHQMLTFWL